MRTQIGRGLYGPRLQAAVGVGLLAVVADLGLAWLTHYHYSVSTEGRWAVALAAFVTHLHLTRGDLAAVGLAPPTGGWGGWARAAALLGLLVGTVLAVAATAWVAAGQRLFLYTTSPGELLPRFLEMCVFAPFLEEAVYRVALCVPLAAVRPGGAVLASGVAFGLLHVAYGNPSPANLLGGFILAWSYLRSGSVYVPVALHAGGNLFILLVWFWLGASV